MFFSRVQWWIRWKSYENDEYNILYLRGKKIINGRRKGHLLRPRNTATVVIRMRIIRIKWNAGASGFETFQASLKGFFNNYYKDWLQVLCVGDVSPPSSRRASQVRVKPRPAVSSFGAPDGNPLIPPSHSFPPSPPRPLIQNACCKANHDYPAPLPPILTGTQRPAHCYIRCPHTLIVMHTREHANTHTTSCLDYDPGGEG